MRNVTISLLVVILLTVGVSRTYAANKQKVFILNVFAHPELKILDRNLLSRIQQEMPHDILQLRNLEFEDVSAYADIQQWNPAKFFEDRDRSSIEKMLRDRGFRMMLVFSLSYAPGREPKRLLLAGRLYDLYKFACIAQVDIRNQNQENNQELMCTPPKKKLDEPGNAETEALCHDVKKLENVMTDVTVDIDSYEDLKQGLRQLFAKLLHIPELTMDDASQVFYSPNESVKTTFTLSSNGINVGKQVTIHTFSVDADLFKIENSKLKDQICAEPEGVFEKLIEVGQSNSFHYATVEAKKLSIPSPLMIITPRDRHWDGFGSLTFMPPPVHGDYILRLRFSAQEEAKAPNSVRSYPKYRCIRVRESPLQLSIGLTITGYLFNDDRYYSVGGSTLTGEIGLLRGTYLSSSQYYTPALYWGGVITGAYGINSTSISVPFNNSTVNSLINSDYIDFRIRVSPDLIRIPKAFSLTATASMGLGVTYVRRHMYMEDEMGIPISSIGPEYTSWHPYFVAEVGGGISSIGSFTAGLRSSFQVLYQWRRRFTPLEAVTSMYDWGSDDSALLARITFEIPVKRHTSK